MTTDIIVCYPNESLKTAMHKMAQRNVGRVPVVEREVKDHLIGIITRKSLIAAYNRALEISKGKSPVKQKTTNKIT